VTPVKAVLFDLGGVLLPFDRERRVAAMVERLDVTADSARAFMASDIHRQLDLGEADERTLAIAVSNFAGRAVGPDEACDLVLSVFEAPNTDLWDIAAALRARVIVGGFSDNPAFVRRMFPSGADLEPMIWSSEIGVMKPSPKAFQTAQARLGLASEAIFFIDDSLANIDQARRMGWDAVPFISNDQVLAELSARGLL
jgi:putative hydrolase of the HAD superfamily